MKKTTLHTLTVLGYCIPYAFLSMYADVTSGSMVMYAVMAAAMGLLCWGAIKLKSLFTLLAGNVLSCTVSLLCVMCFQTAAWTGYFKPLSAIQLAFVLSLIASVIQVVVWSASKKQKT